MTSACYGGCPLLDTSNVRIAYHGRRILELLWRSLRTRCLCQRSLLPLRTMHSAGLFPPDLKPLGSSTCNQWAGIPYRRHFRIIFPLLKFLATLWVTGKPIQRQATFVHSKVAFIILSPSAIEASHSGLMRQIEQFAIITPTYSTRVCCCMPSEWWVVSIHLNLGVGQASQRLSMARHSTRLPLKFSSTSQLVAGMRFTNH